MDDHVDTVGVYLDTPSSKKAEFQRNYRDPARRKEAYLDYYANNNPLASWSEVAGALCVFGLHQETDVVKKTYIQGMHLQSSLSHDIH